MKDISIAIFAYNRPSHLKRLLIALESYKIENINVFIDGPKNNKDKLIQEQIIFMLKTSYKINIKIITRKKNLGLSKSLLKGIDYMSKKYKKFIILEDDVVPFKNFFKFISINLKKFEKDESVSAICGYQFPEFNFLNGKKNFSLKNNYFIPWGWSTWSDKWIKFRKNDTKLKINQSNKLANFFKNKLKQNSFWTTKFILYNFEKKNNFIYPKYSLIKNIGFDGSGINSKISNKLRVVEKKKLENCFHIVNNKQEFSKKFLNIYKKRLNLFY